jgi:hypothetical protein
MAVLGDLPAPPFLVSSPYLFFVMTIKHMFFICLLDSNPNSSAIVVKIAYGLLLLSIRAP